MNDYMIFPNWDCKPSGGETKPQGPNPGCIVQNRFQFQGKLQPPFPHIAAMTATTDRTPGRGADGARC